MYNYMHELTTSTTWVKLNHAGEIYIHMYIAQALIFKKCCCAKADWYTLSAVWCALQSSQQEHKFLWIGGSVLCHSREDVIILNYHQEIKSVVDFSHEKYWSVPAI